VGLLDLNVRHATRLQLGPLMASRADKQISFLTEAVVGMPLGHNISPDVMPRLYKKLWALPWDNARKAVFWLLSFNGLPTAERMHMEDQVCECGAPLPGRAHHFWDCPVAQAVRGEIERGLNHNGGGPYALNRHHVWLCHHPECPGLHDGVWMVVCLAALLAMHKGMKVLTRWRLFGDGRAAGRPPPPASQRVAAASRVARATFWDYVADFLSLGLAPVTWTSEITEAHPFIHLCTLAAGGRGLRLHRV
jgi:hypothetical protein